MQMLLSLFPGLELLRRISIIARSVNHVNNAHSFAVQLAYGAGHFQDAIIVSRSIQIAMIGGILLFALALGVPVVVLFRKIKKERAQVGVFNEEIVPPLCIWPQHQG